MFYSQVDLLGVIYTSNDDAATNAKILAKGAGRSGIGTRSLLANVFYSPAETRGFSQRGKIRRCHAGMPRKKFGWFAR